MRRPRLVSNSSLRTRLSLVALVVTLASLGVAGTVGLVRGGELVDEIADHRLVTIASSRATAVELHLGAVRSEIAALASSPATRDAIERLDRATREVGGQPPPPATVDAVTEHYLVDVLPRLQDVRGSSVGASFLIPDSDAAIYLQGQYTVPDDDDGGDGDAPVDPSLLLDPGDGSAYSSVHPAIHQTYGQIGDRSGFDDLYLIEARSHVIVYSMRKRIDFATSLDIGPHSGSGLARLIEAIAADPSDSARLGDLTPYAPAGDRPTAFVASAVTDEEGRVVGYLAAALGVEVFDRITSGDGTWDGLGQTGDTYLVGSDAMMRTTARPFTEDPSAFLAAAAEPGPAQLQPADRRRIAATGTTALAVAVDPQLPVQAADGAGIVDTVDYRGTEVRTAYRPVGLDDLEWTMLTEVSRRQLDRPIEDYARDMLFVAALFVVAITFGAVVWSGRTVAPIRAIAQRLRRVRADPRARRDGAEAEPVEGGPAEYEELSRIVDAMLAQLAAREAGIEARAAERAALVRRFLPAEIARRSESADGDVLDHVRTATVIVLVLDGIGELVGERPGREVRDRLGTIVDEIDAAATDLGVERIKVTGTTYYAVCGVARPVLDHAARSVAFALAARDLVADASGGELSLRGGVASGDVSVGLAARGGLVYDAWGDTVALAEQLAATAATSTVVVAEGVRAQLPDSFTIHDDPAGGPVTVTAHGPTEVAP